MNFLPQRQVHLDFHTSEDIDGIGSRFDKKQFQSCLKKGHVNSITLFAKCHHGWAYFPSTENQMNPGLCGFDLLSAQIEACREIGVQTPIYISAGFDQKYIVEHPDALVSWHWGEKMPETAVNEKGHKYFTDKDGFRLICFNSPYLEVLKKQVEEVTNGAISQRSIGIALSVGVAVSVGVAMLRVLTGIAILPILIVGYTVPLVITYFVPPIYTGIAFDSGGVASGPMATTFILPFAIGACQAMGGNVLTDAFGVVAMIAMTPLITIQVLGLIGKTKRDKKMRQIHSELGQISDGIVYYDEVEVKAHGKK